MNNDLVACLCILVIACVLLVWSSYAEYEGFVDNGQKRCGVDMAPCPMGKRCMNGYCMSLNAPMLPTHSEMTVEPSDFKNPGGFLHTE